MAGLCQAPRLTCKQIDGFQWKWFSLLHLVLDAFKCKWFFLVLFVALCLQHHAFTWGVTILQWLLSARLCKDQSGPKWPLKFLHTIVYSSCDRCHRSSFSICAHSSWSSGVAHLGSIRFFWSRGWDRWDFPGPPASYNMYIQSWAQNCERPADGHLKLHSCRMKRPTGETDHVSNSVFDCLIVFHSDLPIYQFNFFIHLFNLCHLQQYFFVTTWTLTKFSDLSMFDLDFIRIDTPSELGSVKPDLLIF